MGTKDQIVAGGLTEIEIERLKKKHGPLTLITVDNSPEPEIHLWFKKPNMATLSAVARVGESDMIAAAQVYFKNCLVRGDASVVEDVDIFASVAPKLNTLIQEKKVEVKNF